MIVAPSRAQAILDVDEARVLAERSPVLRPQIVSVRDDALTFRGNRILLAMPCADRWVRGIGASAVILDEAAHFTDAGGPSAGPRVFAALQPVRAVYGREARVYVCSTPSGDEFFTNLYRKAESGELGPDAAVFTGTVEELNPGISREFLESERLVLGESTYRQEYLAEFTAAGSGAFFDEADLRACVGRYRTLDPDQGESWVVAVDPSFSSDPSGIAVLGRDTADRKRLVVARVERWAPKRSREERRRAKSAEETADVQAAVLDRVAQLSREYGHAEVVSDSHMAQVVQDELRARGVERIRIIPWNGRLLTEAFRVVNSHVRAGTISLPSDPELFQELLRVRTRSRSGTPQVELPRSAQSHCDMASALASATLRMEKRGRGRARFLSAFQQKASDEPVRQAARGARVFSPYNAWVPISAERIAEINAQGEASVEAMYRR